MYIHKGINVCKTGSWLYLENHTDSLYTYIIGNIVVFS